MTIMMLLPFGCASESLVRATHTMALTFGKRKLVVRAFENAGKVGYPGCMSTESADGLLEPPFDVLGKKCPSRPVLEHVTGRWGSLVLIALREGPTRFNELRRRVDGVSEKMLAQSLHALERDGFIQRAVHSTIPPRVEYTLTPLGEQTTDKLWEFVQALEEAMPQVLRSQAEYDSAAAAA
jgi:DNA-binding HxlR family transcriptional regulator